MAFTPKQERQGTDLGVETHNTAVPSDPVDIPIGPAVAAGVANMEIGHTLMLGASPPPVSFEWDAKLAVGEQPGEM